MRRTGQSVCGHPHAAALFFRRGRGTPPGHPAAPSSVPACGWAGPGLLDSHRPEPPGPSSSGTARGPPAGSGRGHRISSPGLPSCPSVLCVVLGGVPRATGWHPQMAIPMVRTWWQRRSGFLPRVSATSVTKFVGRKEADRVGSWRLRYVYLRQINSHMCALCVTRKHQLSRSSPRSLSAFVPTVSLWQLVRSSLHSVSLSELPFHGGFYPVSTPITTIRHRWSSFCTWPTYLPLSPESFSRCRLRWTTPPSPHAATETVKRCVTCQKNNDVPAATTPAAHTPAPPGPFRHLQVDYISLPPCKWKTDVLVVIDKFSRWVEAYPTGRATAAHTAKCLVTDFIPRWGLPDCIDSDQGTHFTGQVVKEVSRMLKIKWNLHCPYRPQASGQVERSNRTIKTRLSKMHQEGVPWVEALPAVLCSMRASPNRSVGLSPHEIITGRPMQMQGVIDLRNADVHIASDALIAYCENLTKAVQSAKERVESCWQTPPEGGHTIVPGQWVMIKAFKNKPLEPKWYGPHQVMLITAAAVLCQGRKTWTHVSHCKVVPPPAGIG